MEGKEIHIGAIKSEIAQIMLIRRMAIVKGDMTEEEVDSLISETGREWMAKTENMGIGDVMVEMMMQAIGHKAELEKAKKELEESM